MPEVLTRHDCIGLRLASHGGLLKREFTRRKKTVNAYLTGRLVFYSGELILSAALAGHGLAWFPFDAAEQHMSSGLLIPVLDEWAATFSGYHAYYATRAMSSDGVFFLRLTSIAGMTVLATVTNASRR